MELPVCAQILDAAPYPWEAVHPDPNIQLNGIKWETSTDFESGDFTVILSGDLTAGVTRVGAKGPDVYTGYITGPVCDMGTTTGTPTGTMTQTPIGTIVSTATQTPPGGYGRIIVSDNDQVMTINCNGAAVEVNGNDNTLTLLGTCLSLTVRGNGNWIFIQSHPSLVITNTGNNKTIIHP